MARKYLPVIVAIMILAAGCGKGREVTPLEEGAGAATATPEAVSGHPNPRFDLVEKQLDPGGNLYFYIDVKDMLRDTVGQIRTSLVDAGATTEVLERVAVAEQVIETLGFYGIEDFGVSQITVGGHTRTKSFLRIPEREKGILAFTGGAPHAMGSLVYAPSSTMAFSGWDMDLEGLVNLVREVVRSTGGVGAEVRFEQSLGQISQYLGTDADELFQSMAGEYVFLFSFSESRTMNLPHAPSLSIPEPNLAFGFSVKDATPFDSIMGMLREKNVPVSEKTEGALRRVDILAEEVLRTGFSPSVCYDGEFVLMASHGGWMDEILKAKSMGGGLREESEFKSLREGLPEKVNSLSFASARLGEALRSVIKETAQSPADVPGIFSQTALLESQFGLLKGNLSVMVNEPDGILSINNRAPLSTANILSAMLAPYSPMLAGSVMKNQFGAGNRSSAAKANAEMRNLAVALESYYIDYNQYPFAAEGSSWAGVGDSAQEPTSGYVPNSLTTPIVYIAGVPKDPFAAGPQDPAVPETFSYRYAATPVTCWILASNGPDGDVDIPVEEYVNLADGGVQCDVRRLLTQYGGRYVQYDPTNGAISDGDIMRTGP